MFFVFVGRNATTGVGNRLTGHLSYWGNYYAFRDKNAALEFIEEKERCSESGDIIKLVSIWSGRKYSLGQTVSDYVKKLSGLDYED